MGTSMTVTEARAELPRILALVDQGAEVTLTRHGEPVAVIVRPDVLRSRRAGQAFALADHVGDLLERGRKSPIEDRVGLDPDFARELLAEVRASREAR